MTTSWTDNKYEPVINHLRVRGVQPGQHLKAGADGVVIGDTISSGASALNDLSDVTLASHVNGEVLTYNGAQWVNTHLLELKEENGIVRYTSGYTVAAPTASTPTVVANTTTELSEASGIFTANSHLVGYICATIGVRSAHASGGTGYWYFEIETGGSFKRYLRFTVGARDMTNYNNVSTIIPINISAGTRFRFVLECAANSMETVSLSGFSLHI